MFHVRGMLKSLMTFIPRERRSTLVRRGMALSVIALCWLAAGNGRADSDTASQAEVLKNGRDARARAQAAGQLGASHDASAVKPLCEGLDDSVGTVRGAAAAALGKLAVKSGLPCLKGKLENETSAPVAVQIRRAIARIEDASKNITRPPDAASKWYVAVGKTKTKGDRNAAETDALVQETARTALISMSGFAVAPIAETAVQANGVIAKYKLRGYLLQATIEEPKYDGSKLTVVVHVTMYTYPHNALQGEFAPKLTQSGTPTKDKESEDALIRMAIARAIESFTKAVTASN